MVAPLSYKSQLGYYGLRVNPTFDEALKTVRNDLRIPIPERRAKWYALGPYRAFILDAEQKYNEYEHAAIDYRNSGAELPEAAARVRPADGAAQDPAFDQIHHQNDAMRLQDAYEMAHQLQHQEKQQETAATRTEQLKAIYSQHHHMNPMVDAAHEELEEAGVSHHMAAVGIPPVRKPYIVPNKQMMSVGQPQAPEFPTFELLNMDQPQDIRVATLTFPQRLTYERARELVPRTWSS